MHANLAAPPGDGEASVEPIPAGAQQSTGPPQARTDEPTVHTQPTATTAGSDQPLADPADPAVPQAAKVTAEAAQPGTIGSLPPGGLLGS